MGILGAVFSFTFVLGFGHTLYAAGKQPEAVLKVALLPILDSLPFYVAETRGFFEQADLKAEALIVNSALERDQLMQTGAIDGMLTEITNTANFNRSGVKVQILRDARRAYTGYPLFRILAAPGSNLKTAQDLKGVPVGIAKNTIIEYVTDRLLRAEGLKPGEINKQSVPAIPERFQLLLQGRIKAATLPDPLAKSAIEAGAVMVVDDSIHPSYSVSVLSFSIKSIYEKPESIRNFLAAWDRAAAAINADPQNFQELLLEKVRMPKNIRDTFAVPPYPRNAVPDKRQWDDVMQWMVEKGLLESDLSYNDSVTAEFLSAPEEP